MKPEQSKDLNQALTAQLKSISYIKTSQRTQHTAIIEALRKTHTVMRLIAEELGMKPLPKPPAKPDPTPTSKQSSALDKAAEIAAKIKGEKK